jgi:predicted CXXCH cytochrome family protein
MNESRPSSETPAVEIPLSSDQASTASIRPTQQSSKPSRRHWLLPGALCLGVLVLIVALLARSGMLHRTSTSEPSFPLTPLASSPFLNTKPDVAYVGSEACRKCHTGHDMSYHRTGMGRSMAELNPEREPPDGSFDHPLSKRRYQIRRKDGQMWHRELLLTDGPQEVLLAEYPIKYVIGSGNLLRMYLVEAEGFMVQSPVSWHTSSRAWVMSPGFDQPDQVGFARPSPEMCFYCHAGRSETIDGSLHRMRIIEPVISCERCHGPGALHVARHEGPEDADDSKEKIDHTIVNPTHLSRKLNEAICQQCHLRLGASVVSRGRKLTDFRPGLSLEDIRQEYWFDVPSKTMRLVGHVDQMHLSRCYQETESLTCATCHNPHDKPSAKKRTEYYNAICMNCHQPERCTVDAKRRQHESPENSCIQCHMPRSPTEVHHVAFTHHRIGIHDKLPAGHLEPVPRLPGKGQLRPFLDISRLSDIDRKRSLGLGYLDQTRETEDTEQIADCLQQALTLLTEVERAGLQDGIVDASMVRLRSEMGLGGIGPFAERALASPEVEGQDRCVAGYLYAQALARGGRVQDAVTTVNSIARLRRNAADWILLGDCERALGHSAAEMDALTVAVRINPRLWEIHRYLADYYRQQGNEKQAAWHEQRAVP